MALTLYSAHLVLLATGVLRDQPAALYLLMVLGAMAFAVVWRRWIGQGPLERIVAAAAGATRRHLAARLGHRRAASSADGRGASARHRTARGAAQFLIPLACAGLLLLTFMGGSRIGALQDEAVAPVADAEPASAAAAAAPSPTAPSGPATNAEAAAPQPDEETALEDDEATSDTVDDEE
jgi:hypothetical protein